MVQSFVASLGFLLTSLPSAFLLLYFHEVFRNFILQKLHFAETENAISWVDPISMATLAFFGVSSSGVNQKGRNDSPISYLLSQLFFILFILFLALYTFLKQPESNTYLYEFLKTISRQAFSVFLWNWLPIPPLSGSFFFWQRFYNESRLVPFTIVVRVLFIIALVFLGNEDYWWRGSFISSMIGLP